MFKVQCSKFNVQSLLLDFFPRIILRGVDVEQQVVDCLFLFLCTFSLVDVGQLIALVVRPYLGQQRQRLLFMGFLQLFQCCGNIGPATFRILCHFIEPSTVIVILQLAEWLHGLVQIVVNDGKAVAARFECLPPRESQILCIVGQLHAALQHFRTPKR